MREDAPAALAVEELYFLAFVRTQHLEVLRRLLRQGGRVAFQLGGVYDEPVHCL